METTIVDRTKTAIADMAHQANSRWIETWNHAHNRITQATNTAQQAVTETATQTMNQINGATDQAVNRLAEATEHLKTSVGETVQRTEPFSGGPTTAIQTAIANSVQTWLSDHPTMSWIITHPLISLFGVLFVLWLSWGLFRAIAYLSERIWLAILHAPLKLGRWLLQRVSALFKWGDRHSPAVLAPQPTHSEKLAALLDRLEAMKREQDELLQEIRTILMVRD